MLISYFVITFIVVIYMSVDGIPTIAHFTSRPYSPTFLTLEHQHGSIVTWEGNNFGGVDYATPLLYEGLTVGRQHDAIHCFHQTIWRHLSRECED